MAAGFRGRVSARAICVIFLPFSFREKCIKKKRMEVIQASQRARRKRFVNKHMGTKAGLNPVLISHVRKRETINIMRKRQKKIDLQYRRQQPYKLFPVFILLCGERVVLPIADNRKLAVAGLVVFQDGVQSLPS